MELIKKVAVFLSDLIFYLIQDYGSKMSDYLYGIIIVKIF